MQPSTRSTLSALLLALFLAGACQAPTGGPRTPARFPEAVAHPMRTSDFDVEHYAIDVRLLPETRTIEAECAVRLFSMVEALARVDLDLAGLEVTSVVDDAGRALSFTRADERMSIYLAQPLAEGEFVELLIAYGGTPERGLWFVGGGENGIPSQVFTQGECEDSRGWFPCFDHPSDRVTSEVRVTMPAGWTSVAAGERVDHRSDGGEVQDHWRMSVPHPCYLVTLVAGDFHVQEDTWKGVPLIYLADESYEPWMEASFSETDEVLSFLSEFTGMRYPYAKYSQACVANFPFGGMENISATTLTAGTLRDERGTRDAQSHGLVAHEAAHQWFGDLLTCEDWPHIWLNEGFATYATLLYFEETRGQDEFRARMRDTQESYLSADTGQNRRPTVWNVYKDPFDLFFGGQAYQGGASRLHALRFLLGDGVFRTGVQDYVAENAGRGVVTADFQRSMEKVSGRKLDWFFEQWFQSRGYPEFEIEWKWNAKRGVLRLDVDQIQSYGDGTPAAFRTPVDVEVRDEHGTSLHRIEITRRHHRFELPTGSRPVYVRFDKGGWIPKRMKWHRGATEWIAISTTDDDVNGRRDAMQALGDLAVAARETNPNGHGLYVAEIASRLRSDSSSWVRVDAARALGAARGIEARERLIRAARSDENAHVRTAALHALGQWGVDANLAAFALEAYEAAFSWNTMGAAARLLAKADPVNAPLWIESILGTDSPHGVLDGALLRTLGSFDGAEVRGVLLAAAANVRLDPAVRSAAVSQLGTGDRGGKEVLELLGELLGSRSFGLRRSVVEALARMNSRGSRALLTDLYPDAQGAGERRAIEAVLSTAPAR